VIATKGRAETLGRTLASLSRCEPPADEVIVVDGDESQSAAPVVQAMAGGEGKPLSVRHVASEPGLTRQRNRGVDLASGEVVVFVDDDVEFDPQAIGALADAYDDPEVVGATGRVSEDEGRRFGNSRSRVRRLLGGGGADGTMTRFGYPRRLQDPSRPRDVEFMPGCLMSARRSVADVVRFDERLPGYGLAEDEDFSYRLSRIGRVRHVPEVAVRHERTGGQASGTRRFNRDVVVNRAYLFRKNFPQTPRSRLGFVLLVAILFAHRAINVEWDGLRGLAEGSAQAWRARRSAA
jgi:glycosyltransferase involved in cell wall biosynthesis